MRTFLDTGALLAAFNGREAESAEALAIVEDGSREFVGSDYLKLELYPSAVYERDVVQIEFFDRYFQNVVQLMQTSPAIVADAIALAGRYRLAGGDALLVRAAIDAGAVEFVTTEAPARSPLVSVSELSVRSLHRHRPRSRLHVFWSRVKSRVDRLVNWLSPGH